MTWTFELAYPRPPKGLSANDRAHWAVKSKATATVREQVMRLAQQAGVPTMQRCQVEVVWVVGDKRRRDVDNPLFFYKAICDGLGADKGVSAHIVPDDTPEFMVKLMPRLEYRPGETPHFEVNITRLGD